MNLPARRSASIGKANSFSPTASDAINAIPKVAMTTELRRLLESMTFITTLELNDIESRIKPVLVKYSSARSPSTSREHMEVYASRTTEERIWSVALSGEFGRRVTHQRNINRVQISMILKASLRRTVKQLCRRSALAKLISVFHGTGDMLKILVVVVYEGHTMWE